MKTFRSQLDWRFATKSFDKEKKVSKENLDKILEAIRKAPSSLGLQPYHIYVVSDDILRKKISEVSYSQPQVTEASHLLIFCARNDINNRIDKMLNLLSGGDEIKKEGLSSLKTMMDNFISGKPQNKMMDWASRQTYIALGFGLAICAELEIDACPMEGFDPQKLHKLLDLPENIYPYAYLTIGYRKEDPKHSKFRYPKEDLFTFK